MTFINRMAALAAFTIAMITVADAADIPSAPDVVSQVVSADEWVVSTAPYFWITLYEGDMTINGQTVDMSGLGVFDILDAGDFRYPPLVNYFEARKGRWGGYFDFTLLGLEFGGSDISLAPGPVTLAAGLDFTYALVHTGLIYTAAEWASGHGQHTKIGLSDSCAGKILQRGANWA